MEMIKEGLAKIGGPLWRLVQGTKHSTLGAVVVVIVLGFLLLVII